MSSASQSHSTAPESIAGATARQSFGEVQWLLRMPIPDDLRPLLKDPHQAFHDPETFIKNSRVVTLAKYTTPSGRPLVVRRLNYGKWRHRISDMFRPSRVRRSFSSALFLQANHVRTPQAYAAGEQRRAWIPLLAFLIVDEVQGARNLAQYLAAFEPAPAIADTVAELIARIHNCGCSHRDLKLGNILLDARDRATIIDLDGLHRSREVSLRRSAKDLARLWRALRSYSIPPTIALRFVARYCRCRSSMIDPRSLAALVHRFAYGESRPMLKVTSADRASTLPDRPDIPCPGSKDWVRLPGSGVALVHRIWVDRLAAIGLRSFDAFVAATGRPLTKPGLAGRYRAQIELPSESGKPPCRLYLKRYSTEPFRSQIKRWIEDGSRDTPAHRDTRVAAALSELGFSVPMPVAWGWKPTGDGCSFVLSTEAPGESIERWIERSGSLAAAERFDAERSIAHAIGQLAQRFHRAGWCHRDLYLCHVFVEFKQNEPQLSLIDLQRAFRPRWRVARWRVKDLAQLNYSAEQQGISRSMRLRAALRYFDTKSLQPDHKRMLRRVITKTRSIARHDRSRRP